MHAHNLEHNVVIRVPCRQSNNEPSNQSIIRQDFLLSFPDSSSFRNGRHRKNRAVLAGEDRSGHLRHLRGVGVDRRRKNCQFFFFLFFFRSAGSLPHPWRRSARGKGGPLSRTPVGRWLVSEISGGVAQKRDDSSHPCLSLRESTPPNFRALLLSVQLWLPWSSYPAAVCQSVFLFSSSFSSLSSTLPLPYPFYPYPLFLALCFDLQLVSFPTQSLLYCYTAIFTTDHCTRTKTTTSFAERN